MEVRVSAMASADPVLMDIFKTGKDPYMEFLKFTYQMVDFGYDDPSNPEQVKDYLAMLRAEYRQPSKSVVLGILYGRGNESVSNATGMSLEDTKKQVAGFFGKFQNVEKFTKEVIAFAKKYHKIRTLFHNLIKLVAWKNVTTTGINWIIQSGGSLICAYVFDLVATMLRDEGKRCRPMVVVHDSHTYIWDIKNMIQIADHIYLKWIVDFLWEDMKSLSPDGTLGFPVNFEPVCEKNLREKCELKKIDDNTYSLEGSDPSIRKIATEFPFFNDAWKLEDYQIVKDTTGSMDTIRKFMSDYMKRSHDIFAHYDFHVPSTSKIILSRHRDDTDILNQPQKEFRGSFDYEHFKVI